MSFSRKESSILSQAGFTLLEMIIAVTLVALLAVGLWAIFRVSIHSWSRGTEYMDANQRHRSIMNLVHKQMASAYGLIAPDQQVPGGVLLFNGTENSVQFLSLNSLRFQESPGLTLVSYEVDPDAAGSYSLVEKESRYLGQAPEEGPFSTGSKAIPIFENLTSCIFEYFDMGGPDTPSQWVREWDGQTLRRLPLAISLTMISRDPRGNTFNRHMVVPIKAEPYNANNYINPFGGGRGVIR